MCKLVSKGNTTSHIIKHVKNYLPSLKYFEAIFPHHEFLESKDLESKYRDIDILRNNVQ